MTTVTLEAQLRTETGKGAARALRRSGFVPGVIYGHGEESRSCKIDAQELEKLLTSVPYESTVINLKVDGAKTPQQVLIREVQIHPYRSQVLHIDFLALHKGEKVRLDIPIRLLGAAPGVKEGGVMEHLRHEVEVRTLPSDIPESLSVDVSHLMVGDQVTVADIVVPADVEILEEPTTAIAQVVPPTVHKVEEPEEEEVLEAEEEEGEEAEEPEVVGRGKPSEEEEEAAEEEG
ncbi:MAG: 50S ribosomal protein L25/general stress protein Ctc [Gemmatimonadetes bacterium]|uniref:Large ribosomal subunit protein bL25 n=1 Tax=Candidatus Kutchimonas denitrificans TaxID=3056748 RepID=A0AAE5CBU9_9BACT|nr:50S ribosomal protein L25/general stress protein Ctc [Gemmatimonadota bacterium]NIR75003.1 50S ribosomal protein L25/general stress protein Ctc [Candidatus Kutchimonas denitrificans]NIS01586.1 50S ribosomal protein L25/general stress protein Ctc [Gemmatimonadota bacterium]NIT67324.1 50S ribosomal protein L25/general stress protein Ctc [Gemmatimonadota bacterium]NIU52687.1 50S ribosomal protein L25/general stress protein Ctc [Gemmatimonadota bacterium]